MSTPADYQHGLSVMRTIEERGRQITGPHELFVADATRQGAVVGPYDYDPERCENGVLVLRPCRASNVRAAARAAKSHAPTQDLAVPIADLLGVLAEPRRIYGQDAPVVQVRGPIAA